MLAYVFWHRPRADVEPAVYEAAQRGFHRALAMESACFRLAAFPFDDGRPGYEDWYLVADWAGLGELNESAVDADRLPGHDRVAEMATDGWGAVYALARGDATIPAGAEWLEKPRGEPSDEFIAALPSQTVWRRQLVLGPAPEFCAATAPAAGREAVWRQA
jgi:hypothetical protein